MPLDAKDKTILAELQFDADRTDRELAQIAKVSPAAFSVRKKKLKNEAYIKKIQAILNPEKFDLNILGFVLVKLASRNHDAYDTLEQRLKSEANVFELHNVFGAYDAIIKIRAKNNKDLFDIMKRLSLEIELTTETLIVSESPVEELNISI